MHSDPSATLSGEERGAGVVNGSLNGQVFPARDIACTLPTPTTQDTSLKGNALKRRERLSREEPFGVTAIIGGTNVRFCISAPQLADAATPGVAEPLVSSVKWQELKNHLAPRLTELGINFEDAHHIVLPLLAEKCVSFIASHFDKTGEPPPFHNIAAFDFSVAGVVHGEGLDSTISTTNTGLRFSNDQTALQFISSLQNELAKRAWPAIPQENIAVMNDAAAGLLGETIAGGLQGVKNGLFVIIGTGVGSMGWTTKPGDAGPTIDLDFNELGHRAVFDSSRRLEVVLNKGDELSAFIEEDGSFKSLELHERYVENVLAGPWCAINFVESFKSKPTVMMKLAETIARANIRKVAEDAQKTAEETEELLTGEPFKEEVGKVHKGLYALANLQSQDRTRWAVSSNSHLVRAVNNFLLNPDPEVVFEHMPCDYRVEEMTNSNPEAALPLLAYSAWKEYCKNIGLFLGKAYSVMSEQGNTPDKIIVGGGIGEMANRYPALLRKVALKLIHEHGNVPNGVVDFSRMSPESRECARTYQLVDEKMAEIRAESRLTGEMPH
jgi:hypothetical protein